MSRPRREAAKKSQEQMKKHNQKLDLSDAEEMDESDCDFSSGSSDEYDPEKSLSKNKNAKESEDDEELEEDSLSEVDIESEEEEDSKRSKFAKGRNNKKSRVSNSNSRNLVASLRKDAINKFKARQNSLNTSSTSQKLQDILKKAEYKRKSIFSQSGNSDSDDENDMEKVPNFDCSGGMQLSDSSGSEDENEDTKKQEFRKISTFKTLPNSINDEEEENSAVDLKTIHDNLQNIKNIKDKFTNYSSSTKTKITSTKHDENLDIANLLAMGENTSASSSKRQKKTIASQKHADDSDSDNWEDVEESLDLSRHHGHHGPKQNVEIVLGNFGDNEGKKKKQDKPVDIEAQMKRKFNKRRKEMQEHLHKVELMCWICHHSYVNKRLNDTTLMKSALELLPSKSKQYYPTDKTDLDYFKQITKWFKSMMTLKNTEMYCERLKKRPPLMMSLAIQMKYKVAICRRDYVLIFVCLLRALGIQCRMVQSVVCDPKICPKSELMSLSKAESGDKKPSSAAQKKKSSSKSDSKKKSTKVEKIPQLDGADDLPSDRKRTKRPLRIKGSSNENVDESFVKVGKEDLKSRRKNAGNLSQKVPVIINSPNHVRRSISEKLSEATSTSSVEKKEPTDSEDSKPKAKAREPNGTNIKKNDENSTDSGQNTRSSRSRANEVGEKDCLKVIVSPRRLRGRTRSNEKIASSSSKSSSKQEAEPVKKEVSASNVKPKIEIAESSSATKKAADSKNLLTITSPISKRLRNRSCSNDNRSADSSNSASKIVSSRKRAANMKDEVEEKKMKLSEAPKAEKSATKRPAAEPRKEEVKSKKIKKTQNEMAIEYEDDSDDSSLKYFKTTSKPKLNKSINKSLPSTSAKSMKIDRRILSSDDEETANAQNKSPVKKSKGIDIWVEVYSEKDDKWLAIDVFRNKIDCVKDIMAKATHPLIYVFAWNNDNSVKDVSARYCTNLNTTIRKMRVERNYLNSILNIFPGTRTVRDLKEDEELNKVQYDVPMPTSIAEFKDHPLYALKRHLLKYQAIYPPEPPILGYIRDEAIYPRDCVFTCHSRETWLKEARVVKLYEKPYKVVTTLKWDKVNNKLNKNVPLEVFGIWQTKDYEPPTAENGIVPRNGYGNVELFKPQMLPHGTVHLQLPGLQKVCKKLGVDCAQAIVGFDSNGGWPFPVYDGFIVCKEFEEKVIDAWNREQEEIERKEREKIDKRVYGNWRKLIKGLLIRERLKQKYNFKNE